MSVVCDTGTGYLKLGWSYSTYPDYTIPTILGRPNRRYKDFESDPTKLNKEYFDDEIRNLMWLLELVRPIEHGIIQDWEIMSKIWTYGFISKMKLNPNETSVFLTEAPLNPKSNREKMLETMLELFQFSACKVETQAVLTLIAQGINTGLVLDSGDGVTHCVPVCDSRIITSGIRRIDIAGYDITQYLSNLLLKRGYNFFTTFDIDQVREIKENCCYITRDPMEEIRLYQDTTALNQNYQLPDGRWVTAGPERYQAAEVMFYPGLIGKQDQNVPDMLVESLKSAPKDYKVELAKNVILSGGTTMLPGFAQRVKKGVKEKLKEERMELECKIVDPLNRKILVFLGAAIVAMILENNPEQWISKAEWEEEGARILSKFDSNES